ncbi:MAG: penicillin-binding protein activator, partial [Roseobacter sp.]|nr:penicillin-binding protein activator [Roseobacter sp.]
MFAVFQYARKGARLLVLPLIALTLAACDTLPSAGLGSGTQSGPTVPVALLVPSGSGRGTDELIATSLENAARLAMRDLNGAI